MLLPKEQASSIRRFELLECLKAEPRLLHELDSVYLPTDRGEMTFLKLTDNLQLTLKTQMQWHRNKSWHSYEDIEKRCLLTLTIVEIEPTATDGVPEVHPTPEPI